MKTPQRNFVVEFKSRRRSPVAAPSSIWGSIDLKAVSASVAEDAALSTKVLDRGADAFSTTTANAERNASLTQSTGIPESSASQQERVMADETSESVNTETSTAETKAPVAEPKKQRAPRGLKSAATTATDETADPSAPAVPSKRAKATRAKKAKPTVADVKPVKQTRQPRASATFPDAVATPVTAFDEMADLLQLEEENKKLRKQLAEKLRTENTDLRKRLGVS